MCVNLIRLMMHQRLFTLHIQKLVTYLGVDLRDPKYLSSSFKYYNAINSHSNSLEIRKNLSFLEKLTSEKIVSRHIANRTAGSGLCFSFYNVFKTEIAKMENTATPFLF